MYIIKTVEELKRKTVTMKGCIGFVPTMGALHEGHLSLIRRAREENDFVIVSIFINPTQFLEGEDLDSYPRREEADGEICKTVGVDILFMPNKDEIYERDELRIFAPAIKGFILEGTKRAGHFDGMLQVVMKLLNLISYNKPSTFKAYFGKKDAQQLLLIRQMVKNYFINVEIVSLNTIRDKDGLALSSRNIYLNSKERQEALSIPRALKKAIDLITSGELESDKIIKEMKKTLSNIDLEYIAIVNHKLTPIDKIKFGDTIILIAGFVGKTRLIDNLWI